MSQEGWELLLFSSITLTDYCMVFGVVQARLISPRELVETQAVCFIKVDRHYGNRFTQHSERLGLQPYL